MSGAAGLRRRRTVLQMCAGAALAALLGFVSFLPPKEEIPRPEIGHKVLPDFAANVDKVALIMVTTAEESYHLVRNGSDWVLSEKGSYPVAPEKIARLTRALSALDYSEAMTRDDKKFDRIGLGDPASGGTGALLEVGDGSGNSFAKLVVGYREGRSYVREPDDLQAWAVAGGDMPPLQRGARWLDLDVVSVAAGDIAEVNVRPQTGAWYTLLPADATGQQFRLAQPHASRRVIAAFGPAMTAQALTRFSPIDVTPANTVASGVPATQYIVRLRSGVTISVQGWQAGEKRWVTIGAAVSEGAAPEAVASAGAINARAAGWAFGLTELDWGVYATPLAALVE